MPSHPNSNAAGVASGAAVLLVYLLHKYFNVDLSIYYAGLIVGGAATVVLFIGRDGIKGTALRVWRGSGSVWNGKPVKK